MKKRKEVYRLNKKDTQTQAVSYCAHNLLDVAEQKQYKVFAVSTSTQFKQYKEEMCRQTAAFLCQNGHKVTIIRLDWKEDANSKTEIQRDAYTDICACNLSTEAFVELLLKERESADLVLVDMPPVALLSQALEYAKQCDTVLLVEKYAYSKYKEFEKTLCILKEHGLQVCGVVSYK